MQHIPYNHHQQHRHSHHKPHHQQQHQHESVHQHHSGYGSRSVAKFARHGVRPRPTSVIEISKMSSHSQDFSPPLRMNSEFGGGSGGSSGGSSFDTGWFYSGMSPPPTAPAIMHGSHQHDKHEASSSSVFHFPSSPAFPECSMSTVGSGNTAVQIAHQQRSPLASPDAVVPPAGPSIVSGASVASEPAEIQTAAPQQPQQHETPTVTGRHSISPNRITPEPEIRTRRSSESEVSSPPRGK